MVLSAQRGCGAWQLGNQGTEEEMAIVLNLKIGKIRTGEKQVGDTGEGNEERHLTTEGTLRFRPNLQPNFSF